MPSANDGKGKRWRARYVDDRGREHAKVFTRKVDGQQWLDKQVSDQVTGSWTDPKLSGETFGVLADRWIQTKATRAPKTVAGYRSLLDVVVLPRWRDVPLRDVSFEDLQQWVSALSVDGSSRFEGRGLSASRVIQAHQVVSQVLRYAVKAKHLPANPAEGIELPRKPEVEQRYLTHEQLHRLAVASGRLRTLVLVLGYCGLRFGEAAALRVGDVNLPARRIRVSRSVTNVTGRGLVEGPTKNHSARSVPVPRFLAPLLETEIGERPETELLFASRRGGYVTEGEVRWVFDPAATAVGEDGLTPHELRHTCASLAIAAGANVKVLQTLLGHKTATLTLDRYGHLFPDDLGRIADAFDAAAQTTADGLRTAAPLRAVSPAENRL
ncbi:site-specific integrase [Mycobacterium sp. ITM-2016-00318]|uniref:tyrosine-type recombinase/integrase n=1 Tax=Mycobacterium sp. ITM-2016-00318 TaxID=2099693 RepID=UPI001E650109|nr:site-specific integrase [Mycobacterium sp. ITM-2016-00318]WNG95299.1 site-specific integrase [Mycobacterium sp. ITM-2016-00318]